MKQRAAFRHRPGYPSVFLILVIVLGLTACTPIGGLPGGTDQVQGAIQTMDGRTWVVGQTLVNVPAGVAVDGAAGPGAVVRVTGQRDAQGLLQAQAVAVVQVAPTATLPPTVVKPTPPAVPTLAPARPPATVLPTPLPARQPGPPAKKSDGSKGRGNGGGNEGGD